MMLQGWRILLLVFRQRLCGIPQESWPK